MVHYAWCGALRVVHLEANTALYGINGRRAAAAHGEYPVNSEASYFLYMLTFVRAPPPPPPPRM